MPSPGNQFLSDEFGDIEDYFISDYWLIDQYIGDQLWDWGSNDNGQLGTNSLTNTNVPGTTFPGGTNWKQVSGGINGIVAAIKTDGTLWSWGYNGSGEVGDNTTGAGSNNTTKSTPVTTFAGGTNWKYVDCGVSNKIAIKTDGTLWIWGRGDGNFGSLGNNQGTQNAITPITTFAGGNTWKSVSTGDVYSAAIKTDGTLWLWGYNVFGKLGTNDSITRSTPVTTFAGGSNWKSVTCGFSNTTAIKTDGTLWTWGNGADGRLGINDTISRSTPVTTFAGGNNWKIVDAGRQHMVAIKTNGTLWTWGYNLGDSPVVASGQLGTNDGFSRSTPVTTFAGGTNWKYASGGNYHTSAIKTDGSLWSWGYNNFGQLGANITVELDPTRSTPVTVFPGGTTNWKSISSAGYSTFAIKSGLNVDLS